MKIVILVLITILSLSFGIGSFITACKEKKEKKSLEEYYKGVLKAHYEAEIENKKQKEKLNTGNNVDDVANSVNILQEYSSKR